MERYRRQNLAIKAWQIVKSEGWHSLMGKVTKKGLAMLYAYLPSGLNSMEDVLQRINEYADCDVFSFDVFDTLLRRRVEPPAIIKYLVAEHMSRLLTIRGICISTEEVLRQRNKVEWILRHQAVLRGEDPECSLDGIIRETLKVVRGDDVLNSQEIVNYEVNLEEKATEQMPGAEAILSRLRSLKKQVICVSDTYLSAKQIARILECHGLLKYTDKLYVSSEVGRSKATKKLFRHVIENEGSKIIHIGDDYILDNRIPRMLGIKTLWFHSRSERRRRSELNRLLNDKNKMNYVNAIVRRNNEDSNKFYRLGYDAFGPALTVFVHNVMQQVRKDGAEIIYFIARDGYGLKKIYEILRSSIHSDESLPVGKYMCMSRASVTLPSLHEFGYREIDMFMVKSCRNQITLRRLLAGYGMEPDKFVRIARQYEIDVDEPISDPAHDTKLHELLECNELQNVVRAESEDAKKVLREYLVSIGFMGGRNVVFVDMSGEGLSQSLLEQSFLNDKDYPVVWGYYFNLVNSGLNLDSPKLTGIVSDWRWEPQYKVSVFGCFGSLAELFMHPNHGVTVGYKKVNGKVVPIFVATPQEGQYFMTSQALQGILAYAKDYSTYYCLHNYNCEELLKHVRRNIEQWIAFPPRRDVEVLRGLFSTDDWPQPKNRKLIVEVTVSDIITLKGLARKILSSEWPQGTLRLTPVPGLNWLFHKIITSRAGYKLASHLKSKVTRK